jgi:hypothetical protein
MVVVLLLLVAQIESRPAAAIGDVFTAAYHWEYVFYMDLEVTSHSYSYSYDTSTPPPTAPHPPTHPHPYPYHGAVRCGAGVIQARWRSD